jgi:hypothetical protein
MSSSVNKWRIYCNTENAWVYKWEEENKTPQPGCFNDPGHLVNEDSKSIIEKISNIEVKIKEETKKTQGNYTTEGRRISAGAMTETNDRFSMNYDINLTAIWLNVNDEHKNDVLNCYYEPFYRGTLVSDALVNTSVILVDTITASVANIGYLICIPANNEKDVQILGEIISKNSSTGAITLSGNISKTVSKGTQVCIRVNGVRNFHLSSTGRHCIGANIIGSTYIDKTGIMVFSYSNKSISAKNFCYELEYMY